MSRFNRYFNNGFAGCRCLAHTFDNSRNREVKIFLVPGEFECVGVNDGVDSWIAPVSADPFRVNVGHIIKQILAGDDPRLPLVDTSRGPSSHRRGRTRLVADAPAEVPPARKNRVLLAPGGSEPGATPARQRTKLLTA